MTSFDLNELSAIIRENGYKNVALYFLEQFFEITSEVSLELTRRNDNVNFMIMITCSSGVDTMQWRLNSREDSPDCVIYFGASCLCDSRFSKEIPTYFVPLAKDPEIEQYIHETIRKNVESNSSRNILILSDLTYSQYLSNICDDLSSPAYSVDTCRYSDFQQPNLRFLDSTKRNLLISDTTNSEGYEAVYKPFLFKNKLSDYDLVFFLGECKNLELVLNCSRILILNPLEKTFEQFDGSKEFRKRVSLIEKFKNHSKMMGIVFVNYTSSVSSIMDSASAFSRRQKKAPFFLTLNQSDFQLRLGNFTQLDSFVLVNVCECNFEIAKQTSKYFCPVIFWREFLIVSKQKLTYGGIEWNAEEDIEEEEDEEEDKDESQMQLTEREMFQKPKDAWYGLIVDAGNSAVSDIQPGLSGIASSYRTESELF